MKKTLFAITLSICEHVSFLPKPWHGFTFQMNLTNLFPLNYRSSSSLSASASASYSLSFSSPHLSSQLIANWMSFPFHKVNKDSFFFRYIYLVISTNLLSFSYLICLPVSYHTLFLGPVFVIPSLSYQYKSSLANPPFGIKMMQISHSYCNPFNCHHCHHQALKRQ